MVKMNKFGVLLILLLTVLLANPVSAQILVRQPDGSYVQLNYSNVNTANIYVSGSRLSLDDIFTGVSTVKVKDTIYVNLDIWHVKGEHIEFQTTTTPTDYAQYKIKISGTTWEIYNSTGALEALGTITDFWSKVSTTGSDIRVFDQNGNLMYFWIEEFDYTNQTAIIWVRLGAGSTRLNIAYGNLHAAQSAYCSITQSFEFADDFNDNSLSSDWTQDSGTWSEVNQELEVTQGAAYAYIISTNYSDADYLVQVRLKATSAGRAGILVRYENSDYHYFAFCYYGADHIDVWRKWGDYYYLITEAGKQLNTSTFYKLTVIISSNWTKVYVDNDLLINITDDHLTDVPSGKVGLAAFNGTFAFDDFIVAKVVDPADFGTPQLVSR